MLDDLNQEHRGQGIVGVLMKFTSLPMKGRKDLWRLMTKTVKCSIFSCNHVGISKPLRNFSANCSKVQSTYHASSSLIYGEVMQQQSVTLRRCSSILRTEAGTSTRKTLISQPVSESDECEALKPVAMLNDSYQLPD